MISISIALVIIAGMAFYLVNKWMDLNYIINKQASSDALSTAMEEQLKKFDDRLNNTWSTISNTKEELNALKLSIGLKGNRQ